MTAELVLEQGLRRIGRHLPRLLHVGVCCLDSAVDAVFEHSHRLLMNLHYSLCEEHFYLARIKQQERNLLMDPPPEEDTSADADYLSGTAGLIAYLKSARARGGWRRLWAHEEITLSPPNYDLPSALALQSLVQSMAGALGFVGGLVDRWAEEAVAWGTRGSSRHMVARSLQAYRSLLLLPSVRDDRDAFGPATLRILLAVLECIEAGTVDAMELCMEHLLTLHR